MNRIKQLLNNIKIYIKDHPVESMIVLGALAIAAITHGFNMFHFPYYENDEGIYMSQAWALLTRGELSHYTYWYDHAPIGWMLIAIWTKLTGGFFAFGASVNSGRVLMLVLHVAASFLMYYISKRLTKSAIPGVIAILLFSLSPLGIYFQRRVLLDNIMMFLTLLSFAVLLKRNLELKHVIASAVIFALAVLTKENAAFYLPAFLAMVWIQTKGTHRKFAIFESIAVSGAVVFLYPLYALLKGELFPSGTPLGGSSDHVSLLGTLEFQASRDGGSIFNPGTSDFWYNLGIWMRDDAFIMYAAIVSTILLTLFAIRKHKYIPFALLNLFTWLFLMRGGVVIEFYVIPTLALAALSTGLVVHELGEVINRITPTFKFDYNLLYGMAIAVIAIYYGFFGTEIRGFNVYNSDQTTPQIEAVAWSRDNLDQSSVLAIDNYGWLDYQAENNPSAKQFVNAEYYWKIDRDDAIKLGLLQGQPDNIDIIAMTPQTNRDLERGDLQLLSESLRNSWLIKKFWNDGWGVEIWATKYPRQILARSWDSYKNTFITDNGRTLDPYIENATTSEGQSYSLLRSVWSNDKETFDKVWAWTQKNMQMKSGVFAWKFTTATGQEILIDQGSATDAETDIAMALLFAAHQWEDDYYKTEAQRVINGIWEKEVAMINGRPFVTAGNWANHETYITVNPSYLSPAAYRMFASVDQTHDWLGVVETSYEVLESCTQAPLGERTPGVLPPEWCGITKGTEIVFQPNDEPNDTTYSYNAFRTPWRIALDAIWYESEEAQAYLETLSFLGDEWTQNRAISTAYTHTGEEWESYESVAAYSTNLGYFMVTDPEAAEEIYRTKILTRFYEDETQSYWEDPENYYTQNWAWFGTALYSDHLPLLWDVGEITETAVRVGE